LTLLQSFDHNAARAINDVSTTNNAIWAGEQERQRVKKKGKKQTPGATISPYGDTPLNVQKSNLA